MGTETHGGAADEGRQAANRVRPSANAVTKPVGGEVVLVHMETNRIYTLNRTGARLWELLEQGHILEQAREQMLLEFDVDDAQLRDEIDALVDELLETGLLERDADG